MKIALSFALLALASFGAAASSPSAPCECDPSTESLDVAAHAAPMLVDFELFEEGRKPALLMTGSINSAAGEIAPVNITREQAFVGSVKDSDGVRTLTPLVAKEGVTVMVDRKTQTNPILTLTAVSSPSIHPATKQGQTGVATSEGFTTGWPLVEGSQEHRFKANGKRYRVVIDTK